MKRMKNASYSQEVGGKNVMQFSAEDILWLLQNIKELKSCNVALCSLEDNNVEFTVGDYTYGFSAT